MLWALGCGEGVVGCSTYCGWNSQKRTGAEFDAEDDRLGRRRPSNSRKGLTEGGVGQITCVCGRKVPVPVPQPLSILESCMHHFPNLLDLAEDIALNLIFFAPRCISILSSSPIETVN